MLSQIVKVACRTNGSSPMPMETLSPAESKNLRDTGATCFQKCLSRVKRMVALVSTATGPTCSTFVAPRRMNVLPSQLP